ncbi:GGDEF domain-containing protein [Noviherbaspirillum massiliense]|uniref:GGDEF domain-containing protein n=1 Tax=Noviherbaspirillum massiliense TaxID=1465823 RepID=UPI00031C648C|nr:GGDEF domain-containing protein [Noviherbaspirillum massiliense]
MEALFRHLIDITRHRDHHLLDRSIVSALHELTGAGHVRMLELFQYRDALLVRPRAWTRDGKVVSMEESLEAERPGEPVADYPGLVESIRQRKNCFEEITASGERILWLPIWLNDKVSACFEVKDAAPDRSDGMQVMEGIVNVYRNYLTLLDDSERDSLTGLLNRKTFDEKFSRMLAPMAPAALPAGGQERRSQTAAGQHWLAVIDIDHFKRINDQFGHLYGDEVLILVANLLRSAFRSQDRIFRFGGEEFVILLHSATLENAHKIFERLRASIEKHDFPQVGRVTVSLGFTAISAESPVVNLGHADQALYYAKAHGRNRVCHYEELVAGGELHSQAVNDSAEFFFE